MVAVYQTAYPRIKEELAKSELDEVYTPSRKELNFAVKNANKKTASQLGLLIRKILENLGTRYLINCAILQLWQD